MEQRATIQRWIEQGGALEGALGLFRAVKQELPAVKNAGWVRNPIDQFILAKLEAQGLAPAPEANKRTLIRRLALDLTGLPPKPDEVQSFVEDSSANTYEKLVDKYLASARWGEHRARYWLDAARYGDTHGIHIDNYREIWPYRDWVIQAFNANMPFDRFTTEQLAGDLLPNPTLEQLIATGFQRCNVTTNEAGIIIDEYDAIYAKDRADTIGAVYLGLTVGCATCHDHKFDPIPLGTSTPWVRSSETQPRTSWTATSTIRRPSSSFRSPRTVRAGAKSEAGKRSWYSSSLIAARR
ncbi:MAG: DUF1549 domain-containing protein [Paludibaculum sp.]